MGLTHSSMGNRAKNCDSFNIELEECEKIIAFAGNPNVGKSTLFNRLTGMHQHTGNWSGKTVGCTEGVCKIKDSKIKLIDLPGVYSIEANSAEEKLAADIISSDLPDSVTVICDATCLERNLILVLEVITHAKNVIVCINLVDEAKKKGIFVDVKKLSELLGVPCVAICAKSGKGIPELLDLLKNTEKLESVPIPKRNSESIGEKAQEISTLVTSYTPSGSANIDRKIDKLLTGKITAFPVMLIMLSVIFWITMQGANYPSALLSRLFLFIQEKLIYLLSIVNAPLWLSDILVFGVWRTLSWVVAVMLPPMAIFFPLFTLLEDLGYLPRVAFNLDRCFKKCDACGKQALTMCMGFGCNAAGIVGCRIIDSKRERLIAILTNAFIPCNGRFPTIIALISVFLVVFSGFLGTLFSAFSLAFIIVFAILLSMLASKFLSVTVLKGTPSAFTLELPPYRTPQIRQIILHSVLDRTLYVLGRAVAVAAPAGVIIWLLANIHIGNISLISYCANFLDPIGKLIGLDGAILLAFILALPAAEIFLPILLMIYSASGTLIEYSSLRELDEILRSNGWNMITAICVIVFMIAHFPCSTTLITIKKETNSIKWTILAAALPTAFGFLICFFINLLF